MTRDFLKGFLGYLIPVVVFFGIGYFASDCRPRKPVVKIEYKERVITEYRDVIKPVTITKVVQGPVVTKRVVVVKAPDGTLTTDTTDTKTGPVVTDTKATAERIVTEYKDREVTKIETRYAEPLRWSIAVLTGADTSLKLAVGASVSYRFLGPLTAGVWGITSPDTGGSTAGGVSLGITF